MISKIMLANLSIYSVAEYMYCQRAGFYSMIGSEDGNEENTFIQRGRGVHANIDIPGKRYREDFEERKSVFVNSSDLGLVGKLDLLRLYGNQAVPIEYKSGKDRTSDFHAFQLQLQALCIEDQFNLPVYDSYVYFYQVNKLIKYKVHPLNKGTSIEFIQEVRDKLARGDINQFKKLNKSNCVNCSFFDICIPNL